MAVGQTARSQRELHSAIVIARRCRGQALAGVLTDGQEAPPLNAALPHRPFVDDNRARAGLSRGASVTGFPSPIPKTDQKVRRLVPILRAELGDADADLRSQGRAPASAANAGGLASG